MCGGLRSSPRWFWILRADRGMRLGSLIDIQMEREIKTQLEAKAQRDSLTGVYNSATSHQLIRQVLAEEDRNGTGSHDYHGYRLFQADQ